MRHGRREQLTALGCCLAGAAVALVAGGRAWAHGRAVQGSLQAPLRVDGTSLAPAVPALAVAGLAGGLALIAVRGRVRAVLGACVLICGLAAGGVAAAEARPGADSLAGRAGAALGTGSATAEQVSTTWWPWVALAGSLLYAAGGAVAALRGARWPGMSARYGTAPTTGTGAPTATVSTGEAALEQWRALDRGEDPTL
jgi:uncharacterized membrane protein (TIGR02234 family)